ncbi:MAG: hypothetical protein AAGG56_17945, partial [Pseudomonadota bacterium]
RPISGDHLPHRSGQQGDPPCQANHCASDVNVISKTETYQIDDLRTKANGKRVLSIGRSVTEIGYALGSPRGQADRRHTCDRTEDDEGKGGRSEKCSDLCKH